VRAAFIRPLSSFILFLAFPSRLTAHASCLFLIDAPISPSRMSF